ncbi:MAG: biopolymer transporter ExbD [Pirellulaceae bacterium]
MSERERDDAGADIRPRKHKDEDNELDITPMIDITFLLLAFFVVASKMDPSAAVDLPRASFGDPVSEKDSVVFIITKGSDKDSYVIFKGRSNDEEAKINETEPTAQEEAVGFFVEQQLSTYPEKQTILVKAEGGVKTGAVEVVKRGISLSDLAESRQIYVGVEEAK